MARLKDRTSAADNTAEEFLGGEFLRTMRRYSGWAGTSNPAVDAADTLNNGGAAIVPGEWVGPEWAGALIQLRRGAPVVVVATDD